MSSIQSNEVKEVKEIITKLKKDVDMAIEIEQLNNKVIDIITPALVADIHDLKAIDMLDEVISKFEIMAKQEPNIYNILAPLRLIQDYVHTQNKE